MPRSQTTRASGRRPSIFQEISVTVVLSTICVLAVAVAIVSYFAVHFVLDETGRARVEVLEQISDVSAINRHSMENIMEQAYQELSPHLTGSEIDGTRVQAILDTVQGTMDSVGIDATRVGTCASSTPRM